MYAQPAVAAPTLLVALALVSAPSDAAPSPRGERPFAVALGVQWHNLSDVTVPVPTVQLEWAPLPYLAVEARAGSLLVVGDYTAGVKGYLLDDAVSPFAAVRVGVYHYTTEGQDPFLAVHTVLGLAWVAEFGLELSVEAGGIFQPRKEDFYVKRAAPVLSAAVGFRF